VYDDAEIYKLKLTIWNLSDTRYTRVKHPRRINAVRTFSYAFMVCGCLFSLSAAQPSIGIVRSYGEFMVDWAAVRGNSTLVAGDVVEAMAMNTTITLGATEITLLPESRAALYGDHTMLQRGTTLLRGASSHALEAGNLKIVPTSAHSLVRVGYSDRKLITISARAGAADIFTASGELLASLNPGSALAFEPNSGASGSGSGQASAQTGFVLKGKLTKTGGKYFITVPGKSYEVTSTTVNLESYVGKVISVTAIVVSTAGGVTVVSVGSVTVVAAVFGAGLSSTVIADIVAVGAVAGTIGALGAAGTFRGASPSTP
jgi:hypothetical protein